MGKDCTDALVALVTGASRGIGRGIAVQLAEAGFDVGVNYVRNQAAAEQACREVESRGRRGVPLQADVADADDRARLVTEAADRLGAITLLVNNAGVAPRTRTDILEADENSFDRLIVTNLKGPYFLTQLVARRMIEWREQGHVARPKIVFVTSVSSFAASTTRGDYCVSKAGLSMTVKLFAARLAGEGIGVYEVQPGIIRTDMTSAAQEKYDALIHDQGLLPIKRWGQPEDVGQAVRAIAEDRFSYATGLVIEVDGGFHLRTL